MELGLRGLNRTVMLPTETRRYCLCSYQARLPSLVLTACQERRERMRCAVGLTQQLNLRPFVSLLGLLPAVDQVPSARQTQLVVQFGYIVCTGQGYKAAPRSNRSNDFSAVPAHSNCF